jgi:Tfp pilus assembly protein PilP
VITWRVALAVCGLVATAAAESRDPFSPPASAAPAAGTPLERLDLDQVRLVALVHDARPPRALLEDAAGIGYIVGVGTPVGRRGGTVVAIEPGRLRIREPDTDDDLVLTLGLAAERHP